MAAGSSPDGPGGGDVRGVARRPWPPWVPPGPGPVGRRSGRATLRMLLLGGLAMAVTAGVGKLLGTDRRLTAAVCQAADSARARRVACQRVQWMRPSTMAADRISTTP